MGNLIGLFLILMTPTGVWAGELAIEPVGGHEGYVSNVTEERKVRIVEMAFVEKPVTDDTSLSELIFDDKLTREFTRQYEARFGRTEAEINLNVFNHYTVYEDESNGRVITVEEDVAKQRAFGEFMMRKLAEHHVDNYIKSSPTARPIYELKEKVSNIKVQVRKGYKVRFNYSYSGNYVTMRTDNPYDIENRLVLQMDPNSIGPSEIQDSYFSLGYPITTTVSLGTQVRQQSGEFSIIGKKNLGHGMSASLTGSTYEKSLKNNLILVGFVWR